MRMRPAPLKLQLEHDSEKLIRLKIREHEKHKELYTLIQLEQSTRLKIRDLMIELGLNYIEGYAYTPASPAELIDSALRQKENTSGSQVSDGSDTSNISEPRPKEKMAR